MMEPFIESIVHHFSSINDPRIERTKGHNLIDILIISLCAIICGAEGPVQIEAFGHAKYDWFRLFLALPNGIPSHDTIGRVLARINPKEFETCFMHWIRDLICPFDDEIIAIDGKTVRHSFDRATGQSPIHMVSAWASGQQMILGQLKTATKSNEITAIPQLLTMLDIRGGIITIDALGCQRAIVATIIDAHADYVLSAKDNQPTVFETVQASFAEITPEMETNPTYDTYETEDTAHGRQEIRQYATIAVPADCPLHAKWKGLQSFGMVTRIRATATKTTEETHFFISSLPSDAGRFAHAVRTHWTIENQVHWVLDVTFREDESRIRMDHGPENMAVLRHMALNLLHGESAGKGSIKLKRMRAGWNTDYLAKIIGLTASATKRQEKRAIKRNAGKHDEIPIIFPNAQD